MSIQTKPHIINRENFLDYQGKVLLASCSPKRLEAIVLQ